VTLDLALSARLPAEYVGGLEARSRHYSRFAEAKTLAEVSRLVRELKERYGPPPRGGGELRQPHPAPPGGR
jgi:transcription-repair coupling factor (superfamily II helicase)